MQVLTRWMLVALCALATCTARAATQPLFASDDALQISISAPLENISRARDSDEYFAGNLEYIDDSDTLQKLNVRLRARGNFRRRDDICGFPPLRLNFAKKELAGTLFEGQDKLKLVTHCQSNSPRYEQLVLREYLAYKMLQVLTPNSFAVRLLKISWHDTADNDKPIERYGFLIEDDDLLAARIRLATVDVSHAFAAQLDRDQASLVGIFQYMIGNTDFSMLRGPDGECCHNIVQMQQGESLLPVPYDFDYAGMVNAPYAEPNPKLKIRSVRTRLYRGRCQHNSLIKESLKAFRDAEDEIFDLIESQEGMTDATRRAVSRYIEGFYDDIGSAKRVDKQLTKKCV